MAYCTNTDLLGEFKGLTAWNSQTVAATTVDTWCTEASNLIDAKIGGKYSTPVAQGASPNSYSLLQMICKMIVRPRIAAVLQTKTGDQKTSQGPGSDTTKAAMDLLEEIRSGKTKLNDAVLATSADGVESYTNDNTSTLGDDGIPTFTRDGDEW